MGMFDLVAYNWQVLWSVITQLTLPQSKMKKVLRIKFLHLQTSLRFLLRDDEAESSTSVFLISNKAPQAPRRLANQPLH
jgi:hypothetical protein